MSFLFYCLEASGGISRASILRASFSFSILRCIVYPTAYGPAFELFSLFTWVSGYAFCRPADRCHVMVRREEHYEESCNFEKLEYGFSGLVDAMATAYVPSRRCYLYWMQSLFPSNNNSSGGVFS